ncbi:MAG: GDP-mannose 4,6-dehydratase, partial [Proteobacteria bacterium]|nr:GDP-mannose 4,6-dehydratase [Pseudomonadota bacterium]
PTIITQIAAGKRRIKLGALTPTRDFNFVTDTVAGFIAIARADAAIGEVVNVGSGFEVSIGDTALRIAEVMGAEIEIECDEARLRPEKSEVERLFAGNEKAARLCGWTPAYGGLEGFGRGLAETARWFADAENRKAYKADLYNI